MHLILHIQNELKLLILLVILTLCGAFSPRRTPRIKLSEYAFVGLSLTVF